MEKNGPGLKLLEEGKLLPSKGISTPFGEVETPPIELPPLKLPPRPDELSERQKKAFDHALGTTGAQIVGLFPVIGSALSDILEDIHSPKLRNFSLLRKGKVHQVRPHLPNPFRPDQNLPRSGVKIKHLKRKYLHFI